MLSALDPALPAPYTFIVPNGTLNSREEMIMSPSTRERPLPGKVALVTGGSRDIMRAIRAEQFSGYEGLNLVELPKPAVSDGKVLLRVTPTGVTPLDNPILSAQF